VVEHWEKRGMSEARIRKLAIENYARVLKAAMAGRQA
jgi:microsomal dipeptidase-like Zn-dependent dipeptidase